MKSGSSVTLTLLSAYLLVAACTQTIAREGLSQVKMNDSHAPLSRVDAATVRSLGQSLARCYWAFLLNYPWNEPPAEIFLLFIESDSERLGFPLSASKIKSLHASSDFSELYYRTRTALYATYGEQAAVLFDYAYNLEFVRAMLPSLSNFSPDVRRGWTISLAAYLFAAASAAQKLGISQAEALRGAAIASELTKELSVAELEAIERQVHDWHKATEDAVDFLARGVPTPMPTPTGVGIVGTDIIQPLPMGSFLRGEELLFKQGCIGCHSRTDAQMAGPPFGRQAGTSLAERAAERIRAPDYTGAAQTVEQYLLESIVLPNIYVVPGYPAGIQPNNYGEHLTTQEASDLITFLISLDEQK